LKYGGTKYHRIHLINNHLDWKWEGILHEHVESPQAMTSGVLEGVANLVTVEGCRSQDTQKYQKDAQILEKALEKDPNNSRYVFYLAQSYRDAGEKMLAIKNYERRVEIGGWDQEVFFSLYQIAKLQEGLEMDPKIFIESYYKAYGFRPSRIEPLYCLASYYRKAGNYRLGYALANLALAIPFSDDMLFVEEWMHKYGMLLEQSICAYYLEKYLESRDISNEILNIDNLPEHVRLCVENNLKWSNSEIQASQETLLAKNELEEKINDKEKQIISYEETIIIFASNIEVF